MKKYVLFILTVYVLLYAFAVTAFGEKLNFDSESDINSLILDEYRDLISSFDSTLADKLPTDFGTSPEDDASSLTAWDFILGMLGESFSSAALSLLPSFAKLVCLIVVISVLRQLTSLADPKSADFISSISSLCISGVFILSQYDTVVLLKERLADMSNLASCITPILIALYSAGGNTATAGVSGSALSIFTFTAEEVFSKMALPFFGAMFCLVTVSSSGALMLDGFIRTLKKSYTNLITLVMSVFCAILASQSLIASARDSVSLRAVKFITSSSLPVVGSSVGETLKTLAAGVSLLRKSVGVIGIVMILIMTLPTLILLLLNGSALNFCSSLAETLGCNKEKALLEGISGIYGCLCATLAVSSVMLVFILILLSVSSVAIR